MGDDPPRGTSPRDAWDHPTKLRARVTPAGGRGTVSLPEKESNVPGTKRWIVGVDLGGTNIVTGLLPMEGGPVQGLQSLTTESQRGPKFVVDRIIEMIEGSISMTLAEQGGVREDVAGVGIGSPGP